MARAILTDRCDGAPRVVIVVEGGMVISVLSETNLEVGIVDFDCQGAGDEDSEAFGGWHDSEQFGSMDQRVADALKS